MKPNHLSVVPDDNLPEGRLAPPHSPPTKLADLLTEHVPHLANSLDGESVVFRGRRISGWAVLAAHFSATELGSTVEVALQDSESFQKFCASVGTSSARSLWFGFGGGILTPEQSSYLELRLRAISQPGKGEIEPADPRASIARVSLPQRALPEPQTFLKNAPKGELAYAGAVMTVVVDGKSEEIIISQDRTALLLVRAQIANAECAEYELTTAQGQRRFNRLIRPWVEAVLAPTELAPKQTFELRFQQYVMQGNGEVDPLRYDPDKLRHVIGDAAEQTAVSMAETPSVPNALLDLSRVDQFLRVGGVVAKEIGTVARMPNFSSSPHIPDVGLFNPLQIAQIAINNATKSGDWTSEVIRNYLQYVNYLPQYLEHRVGILLLATLKAQGKLPEKSIETFASIGAGPLEEASAWASLLKLGLVPGMPTGYNVDLSLKMLEGALVLLAEDLRKTQHMVIRDMRSFTDAFSIAVDLIEWSSQDSAGGNAGSIASVAGMLQIARKDTVFRLHTNDPITDRGLAALERVGMKLVVVNSRLSLTPDVTKEITAALGPQYADRCEYKLGARHVVTVGYIDTYHPEGATEFVGSIGTEKLFGARQRMTVGFVGKRAAKAVNEELLLTEKGELYKVLLTVLSHPQPFVTRNVVTAKHLDQAAIAVSPLIDAQGASAILRGFLAGAHIPEVAAALPIAITLTSKFPEARRHLPVSLARAADEATKESVLQVANEYPDEFTGKALHETGTSPREKAELVLAIQAPEEALQKAASAAVANEEIIDVVTELDALVGADVVSINIPVACRFNSGLKSFYHRRTGTDPSADLNLEERRQLFDDTTLDGPARAHVESTVTAAIRSGDAHLAAVVLDWLVGITNRGSDRLPFDALRKI